VIFSGVVSCHTSSSRSADAKDSIQTSPAVSIPSHKEIFPTDSVISRISCLNDPSLSFALYLPRNYNDSSEFPVIIFFDPHGNGDVPLKKYREDAAQLGYVLAGSNDSKNGLPLEECNRIASMLLKEIKSRFHTGTKNITLAGFSGGAKVALSCIDNDTSIRSVIYAGAATPVRITGHSVSYIGFAGTGDMNYSDLLAFDESLSPSVSHFLIEWNGKHEWVDSAVFKDSFYWCAFNSMRSREIKKDDGLINEFIAVNHHRIISSHNDPEKSMLLRKMICFLNGLADTTGYANELKAVEERAAYQNAMQRKHELLEKEQLMKSKYMQAFQEQNLEWWKREISHLRNTKDASIKSMNERLLAFISLACYSISNNAISSHQFRMAEKMLAIYKMADPSNPDQPFLLACLYTQEGQQNKAIKALQEAVNLGLNDRKKIMEEPALQPLQTLPEFQTLINRLKS
jgi:hypothetical protein